MKLKWQWFLGGQNMFWVAIIAFVALTFVFITTYIIDPMTIVYIRKQAVNTESIKTISEKYITYCGIQIDKPIEYRFVEYTKLYRADPEKDGKEVLGTFHEWNNTYYIDISVDLYKDPSLIDTVIHETRHVIVEYLRDKGVINLVKYTEEIADRKNEYYDNLFDSGVYLLKLKESKNG